MTVDPHRSSPMATGEIPPRTFGYEATEARVRTGDGLVARNGSLFAVLGPGSDTDAVVDRIQQFDEGRHGAADLLALARSLPAGAAIAIALLAEHADLVLFGSVRCEVAGSGGDVAFEGSSAVQLVSLPAGSERVVLALAAADAPANRRTALVDGVTPGGGIELRLRPRASELQALAGGAVVPPPPPAPLPPPAAGAPPPPVPPMPASASASVVNALLLPDDDPTPTPEPLPESPEAMPAREAASRPAVQGLACGVGHVNRIDAPYCSSCGRRLQGTVSLVSGPRPSLGTLIFDDGSAFGLDHGYVIGREPTIDPAVRDGTAHPLALDDPERAISRVHAEIRLDGWDTLVVDRGSANGTHVAVPGESSWQRLTPDMPVVLGDGWSVAVGRRTFVFQQR
jgi:hypothetical protein